MLARLEFGTSVYASSGQMREGRKDDSEAGGSGSCLSFPVFLEGLGEFCWADGFRSLASTGLSRDLDFGRDSSGIGGLTGSLSFVANTILLVVLVRTVVVDG